MLQLLDSDVNRSQNAPKVTTTTPPNNHNNNIKHESALMSGVSLDAGALAMQMQKKPYANIENGVLPTNGPYGVQNQNTNKFMGNSQISC